MLLQCLFGHNTMHIWTNSFESQRAPLYSASNCAMLCEYLPGFCMIIILIQGYLAHYLVDFDYWQTSTDHSPLISRGRVFFIIFFSIFLYLLNCNLALCCKLKLTRYFKIATTYYYIKNVLHYTQIMTK